MTLLEQLINTVDNFCTICFLQTLEVCMIMILFQLWLIILLPVFFLFFFLFFCFFALLFFFFLFFLFLTEVFCSGRCFHQQQRVESPTVTATWHASKYTVHELHQKYIRSVLLYSHRDLTFHTAPELWKSTVFICLFIGYFPLVEFM